MCSYYRTDGEPLSIRNRKKLCLLQRFEPCEAVDAQSINQPESEAGIEFNKLCQDKKYFFSKNVTPTPSFILLLHQSLTFSCFSKPNPLSFPAPFCQ